MEKNVNFQVAEATKAKGNETQVLNPVLSESIVDKTTSRQKKKTKSKSNLEKTLEKYRNLYRRQVTKNTKTRQAVLNCAINELGVSYGRKEFLKELYPRIFRLLDSKKFEKDCQEAELFHTMQQCTLLYRAFRMYTMCWNRELKANSVGNFQRCKLL